MHLQPKSWNEEKVIPKEQMHLGIVEMDQTRIERQLSKAPVINDLNISGLGNYGDASWQYPKLVLIVCPRCQSSQVSTQTCKSWNALQYDGFGFDKHTILKAIDKSASLAFFDAFKYFPVLAKWPTIFVPRTVALPWVKTYNGSIISTQNEWLEKRNIIPEAITRVHSCIKIQHAHKIDISRRRRVPP